MSRVENAVWTARRYLFRRDFIHKVKYRVKGYRRRAERDAYTDLVHVYAGLAAPAVILDVGANIGLVTSKLRRLFPSADVHAFEPTDELLTTIRRRLAADQHVIINPVAVSDKDGTATFHVDNKTHGGGSNSLLEHSANFASRNRVDRYESITVNTVTLDSYTKKHQIDHIDVLKLDIEGAEIQALQGAHKLLQMQRIDFIVSEFRLVADYEGQPLFMDLVAYLQPLGYTVVNIYSPSESPMRQALFGDAVFVSDHQRERLQDRYGPKACGWEHEASSAGRNQLHAQIETT